MNGNAGSLLGMNVNRLDHITHKLPSLGIKRAELFNFTRGDLPAVQKALEQQKLVYSIHAPVPRPDWYPFPPTWTLLNYADPEKRALYLRLVTETVETSADIGAQYVVVHFPGPITAECEAAGMDVLSDIADRSADALSELSIKKGVTIHIEGFGPSPFLNIEFIHRVMDRNPDLRYCFDIAHNHIAGQRDLFDYFEFLNQLLPHLGSVHLWQARHVEDYLSYRHLPLHPAQSPEEGWIDVERVIHVVRAAQPGIPFVLEYPAWFPEPWSHLDYREGVYWLREILETSS